MKAFPQHPQSYDDTEMGMSLRDYFAAHAPERPHWYEYPTFPTPKPNEPKVPVIVADEYKEWINDEIVLRFPDFINYRYADKELTHEEGHKVDQMISAAFDYDEAMENYRVAKRDWSNTSKLFVETAWAYAWADAMIKIREER